MQILSLAESVVSEDLDVTEHGLDDLLCPGKFSLNLLTIVLGVFRMEMVDPLGLVLYPSLDVIQLAVSYLCFLVNLFCKSLKLFQAFDLLVDHLISLLQGSESGDMVVMIDIRIDALTRLGQIWTL